MDEERAEICRGEGLRAHNELRAVHGAPPLEWSEECSRLAKAWADRCEQAGCLLPTDRGSWRHLQQSSYDGGAWQSLPWSEASAAANAVQSWYSSAASAWSYDSKGVDFSNFEHNLEQTTPNYRDFLRLLWVSTEYVGMAESESGRFVVAVYDPPLPHPVLERVVKANLLRPGSLMARRAPKLHLTAAGDEVGACQAGCQQLWLRVRLRTRATVQASARAPTQELRRLFRGVPGRFVSRALEFVNEVFSQSAEVTVLRRLGHLRITTDAHGSYRAYNWEE